MFVNNVQKQTFWLPNVYKCEQNTFIFLTNVQKRIFYASNVDNFQQNTIQMLGFSGQLNTLFTFFGPIKKLIMITIWSYWSPNNSKYHYQYNDHEFFVINSITKIMITNVSGQIRYQYNDHERFLGPLITGNVHRAHDHIHDLQRLRQALEP